MLMDGDGGEMSLEHGLSMTEVKRFFGGGCQDMVYWVDGWMEVWQALAVKIHAWRRAGYGDLSWA